jgi:hypothetical protein
MSSDTKCIRCDYYDTCGDDELFCAVCLPLTGFKDPCLLCEGCQECHYGDGKLCVSCEVMAAHSSSSFQRTALGICLYILLLVSAICIVGFVESLVRVLGLKSLFWFTLVFQETLSSYSFVISLLIPLWLRFTE